jgi:UDP-N-acetylmuramate dehydrogenase
MAYTDLTAYNAYRIPAKAASIYSPTTRSQLLSHSHVIDCMPKLIGHGNNIIFSADTYGFESPFLSLADFRESSSIQSTGRAYFSAGYSLREACLQVMHLGLSGMEELWDIPSSIGGAAYMNAGAYGRDLLSLAEYVDIFHWPTRTFERVDKSALDCAYRSSRFMREKGEVIVGVSMQLSPSEPERIACRMREIGIMRRSRFPYSQPNAGSLFKRPTQGLAASQMLELAGCKGMAIGTARISDLHAGFCIATSNPKGADIIELAYLCADTVKNKFGILLELEQVIL